MKNIISILLLIPAIILIIVPLIYWIQNPGDTAMEILISNYGYYILAIVCLWWSKKLITE